MSAPKISIRNLFKIFGKTPDKVLPLVQQGLSKDDLLAQHNHVLGINNVSIDIAPHGLQVIMGLSGSGKSTLIRHINRLIDRLPGKS